jgi:hypothetical protein
MFRTEVVEENETHILRPECISVTYMVFEIIKQSWANELDFLRTMLIDVFHKLLYLTTPSVANIVYSLEWYDIVTYIPIATWTHSRGSQRAQQ